MCPRPRLYGEFSKQIAQVRWRQYFDFISPGKKMPAHFERAACPKTNNERSVRLVF